MEEYSLESSLSGTGVDKNNNNNNNNDRDDHDDDNIITFDHPNNRPSFCWKVLKYVWNWIQCILYFVLDLLSADNNSLVSWIGKITITVSSYCVMVPNIIGQLLWGMMYLIDHGWYPLAVTTSTLILLFCSTILTLYEWMWRWQEKRSLYGVVVGCCWPFRSAMGSTFGGSNNNTVRYHRPFVINIMDDNEIDLEEDLSLYGWMKKFGRLAGYGLGLWFPYCLINIYFDFWIWDRYINVSSSSSTTRHHHPIIERALACLAVTPVLVGAAVLLYYAHPPFYRWHHRPPPLPSSAATTTIRIVHTADEESLSRMDGHGHNETTTTRTTLSWNDTSPNNMDEGDSSSGLQWLLS